MTDVKKEQDYAEKNAKRITLAIPSSIAKIEDGFAEQMYKAKVNPANKLISLYSFMNELYSYISEYTPCKKGCSSCCHYKVDISAIEIAHIEKHSKVKKRKKFKPKENFHGQPCPFLKDGACSIYDTRPFLCRRHVTLTSTNIWCAPETCNDEQFTMLGFSGVDDAYNLIREQSSSLEFFDIRQVFD